MSPDEIGQILDELGKRLGPSGQAAWATLVRQASTEGAIYSWLNSAILAAVVVGFVVVSVVLYRRYRTAAAAYEAYQRSPRESALWAPAPDKFDYAMPFAGAAITTIIVGGFCVWSLTEALLKSANPEFYAIRFILQSFN